MPRQFSRVSFLTALLLSSVAHAQDAATPAAADAPAGGLEEIVVTAQKRVENLQSVPIAVSAVSGNTIEDLHAVTLQGLQGKVPNIQLNNFSNTPNSAVITIRGIGVIEPDPYAGNTVSIVVDGVPQFFSMGALVDLYDIGRVEVLRGPQGTLFGANTTGGVVNIVTEQPTGEFGGKAQVSYGNYNRLDASVALNVPIVDDVLAGKVVVSHHGRDGWTTNVVDGTDMGSRNVTILRGYLKYTPSANFDATLIGEYDRSRNGAPIVINGAYPGEILYATPGVNGMYQQPCTPGVRCHAPRKYLSANSSEPDLSDMNTYRATLTMNLRETAIGDITSITAYKDFNLLEYTDQDGTPESGLSTRRYTTGWQFSQEVRTSADITDSINVIAGVFYMKTHYKHLQGNKFAFAGPGLIQFNSQDQDNWSLSAFAQGYADLTDKLRLQAGIRFTREHTAMLASTITSLNLTGPTDYFGTGNLVLDTAAPPRGKKSWDNVGWKIGLDYQALDDVLIYGNWARGFKSGGFSGRIGIAADLGPYEPEKVDTFEIGFKGDFLDNRLRTNLALFYTKYRDMQIAQIYFKDGIQGNSIINAAESKIKGAELEVAMVPVDGLTLTATGAYLDAKYKDFPYINPLSVSATNPNGIVTNLKGEMMQNAPKWSATASANYEFALGDGMARANVSYSYVGQKYLTAVVNVPRTNIQPTHLVDANLDWTPSSDKWSIGLWARNLFDNRYMGSVYDSFGFNGWAAYTPPREYGVTFKVNW